MLMKSEADKYLSRSFLTLFCQNSDSSDFSDYRIGSGIKSDNPMNPMNPSSDKMLKNFCLDTYFKNPFRNTSACPGFNIPR